MVVFGELPIVFSYAKIFDPTFWFAMTMAGLLGFSMGYVTGYQIQMTSPLTHNVSGTAKSYVQTLMAVVAYAEVRRDWLVEARDRDRFRLDENIALVDFEPVRPRWLGSLRSRSSDRDEARAQHRTHVDIIPAEIAVHMSNVVLDCEKNLSLLLSSFYASSIRRQQQHHQKTITFANTNNIHLRLL